MAIFTYEADVKNAEKAEHLYDETVSKIPICDVAFLPRVPLQRINTSCSNITEWWLRNSPMRRWLMRACDVSRSCIEGNTSDYDAFRAWCCVMPDLVGHPLYEESHWELQRFFDCNLTVNPDNCDRIWHLTAEHLMGQTVTPADLLRDGGVKRMCIPLEPWEDPLCLKKNETGIELRPIFTVNGDTVAEGNRAAWLMRLSESADIPCKDWNSVCDNLRNILDRFEAAGCRMAAHTLTMNGFVRPHEYGADRALRDTTGQWNHVLEMQLLRFLMTEYARRGWIMEIRMMGGSAWEEWLRYAVKDRGWDIPALVLSCNLSADERAVARLCGLFGQETGSVIRCGGVVSEDGWNGREVVERIRRYAARHPLGRYPGLRTHLDGLGGLWQHEQHRRALCRLLVEWDAEMSEKNMENLLRAVCFSNVYELTDGILG